MLDLIEKGLLKMDFGYQRIDGQKSLGYRQKALEEFKTNPACTIMLATIGSVGEGY